jgi:hypothetical protein
MRMRHKGAPGARYEKPLDESRGAGLARHSRNSASVIFQNISSSDARALDQRRDPRPILPLPGWGGVVARDSQAGAEMWGEMGGASDSGFPCADQSHAC